MDTTTPVSTSALSMSGMSRRAVETALRDGTLERIRRGHYDSPDVTTDVERHRRLIRATLADIHPDSVVSHASAAVLHGIPVPTKALRTVSVTRDGRVHQHVGRTLAKHLAPLPPADVVVVDGIRVTSLDRTAADLARALPAEWGVVACDVALRRGVERGTLEAQTEVFRGFRGIDKLRWAAAFADGRAESPAESVSRVRLSTAGVPAPVLQFEIRDVFGRFVARTDFCWPEYHLVGEVDGAVKYGSGPEGTGAAAIMAEKRREEAIRQAGFWVVRWGWQEAMDPAALGHLVGRALEVARLRTRAA